MPRGTCKHCGCTDDAACRFIDPWAFDDEEISCSWANVSHTLCSNPECLKKEKAATR